MITRLSIAAFVIAAIAVGVLVAVSSSDDTPAAEAVDTTGAERLDTAIVARTDLVETTEVAGTLGFGPTEPLPNHAGGVVTAVPEAGSVIGFGEVLYEVGGRPVILLEGDTPMYRTISSRSSDGEDVRLVEEYLASLGFLDEDLVDTDVTGSTTTAIRDWEESLGIEETGSIALGTFVVRPEPVRISSVDTRLGSQVTGGSVVSTSDTERLVSVALDTSLTGLLAEDQQVDVELPDGSTVTGTVTFVSSVAVSDGNGPNATSYLEVEIVLDGSGTEFDESPVTVHVEEILEADAVVVPVASLLALAEGGYAVETVVDGVPVLVGVELGTFHDNDVSIFGDVSPGDEVVVP